MFNDSDSKQQGDGASQDGAKGKTAIDAKRGTIFHMDPRDLVIQSVDDDTDVGAPEHARRHAPLDPDMVANIRYHGVKEPVLAFKRDGKVIVNTGNRRTLHARAALALQTQSGEPRLTVPVMLEKGDDATLYESARITNRFRRDEGPLASAYHAQHLAKMGRTTAQIALAMGVAEQTVLNWQTQLSLDPEVIKAIETEAITPTAGMALAPLPRPEQVAELRELVQEMKETGTKVPVSRVKERVAKRTGRAPSGITPSDRVKRATALLSEAALWTEREASKDACWTLLEKLAKVVTGRTMAKLHDEQKEDK